MPIRLRTFRIRGYFDRMDHAWTMKFVEHRVAGHRVLRLIGKWLKAGVSEDGGCGRSCWS
jgi:retron-type reverse transcriptase